MRVAACTPRIDGRRSATANAEETLALMREGDARHVDLMVFPELGLSAYAIDDSCCRTRCSTAWKRRIARWSTRHATLRRCCSSARRCATTGGSTTARVVIARGRDPRRGAEDLPAQLSRVLREALVRPGRGHRRPGRSRSAGAEGAVRHRPDLRREPSCPTSSSTSRSARTSGPPTPPSTHGRARRARRSSPTCRPRTSSSARPTSAHMLCRSQSARAACGLRLFGRRARREHHRPRVGRPGHRSTSWATCWPRRERFAARAELAWPTSTSSGMRRRAHAHCRPSTTPPRRSRPSGDGVPARRLRAPAAPSATSACSARSAASRSCPTDPTRSTPTATRHSTSRSRG